MANPTGRGLQVDCAARLTGLFSEFGAPTYLVRMRPAPFDTTNCFAVVDK